MLDSEFHASNFMLQALISNCRNLEALNGFTKVRRLNVLLQSLHLNEYVTVVAISNKGGIKRINTFKELFCKLFF